MKYLVTLFIENEDRYQAVLDCEIEEIEKLEKQYHKALMRKGNRIEVRIADEITGTVEDVKNMLKDEFGEQEEEPIKPAINMEIVEAISKTLEELRDIIGRLKWFR